MRLGKLARFRPAALGELVPGAVPQANGERLGHADLLDQGIARLDAQSAEGAVDDPGRIPKLLGASLAVADRLPEPGRTRRWVIESDTGDRHTGHRHLFGLLWRDRPRATAAAPLGPRRIELLHDQDALRVVLANQVAALRQTDSARQLELYEAGSGYRVPGRISEGARQRDPIHVV